MSAALKLKRSTPNLQSLIPQLKQFGLNPREWQLEEPAIRSTVIRLKHRQHRNFQMTGVYAGSAEQPVWNEIFLTSI